MKKSTLMEESINRAYVKLIRTAERFIYIGNQYFLGSAYAWPTDSKVQLSLLPGVLILRASAATFVVFTFTLPLRYSVITQSQPRLLKRFPR